MARVSSWMQANDVACGELSGEALERFWWRVVRLVTGIM